MSHLEHRAQAPTHVRCYVLTVSDTRTEETDGGGRTVIELLTAAGHTIVDRQIVKDEPDQVRATIATQLTKHEIQTIITTGGTGISSRDRSYEAVTELLEKRLTGFGELVQSIIDTVTGWNRGTTTTMRTSSTLPHYLCTST